MERAKSKLRPETRVRTHPRLGFPIHLLFFCFLDCPLSLPWPPFHCSFPPGMLFPSPPTLSTILPLSQLSFLFHSRHSLSTPLSLTVLPPLPALISLPPSPFLLLFPLLYSLFLVSVCFFAVPIFIYLFHFSIYQPVYIYLSFCLLSLSPSLSLSTSLLLLLPLDDLFQAK